MSGRPKGSGWDTDTAMRMYLDGKNDREIAEQVHVSISSVFLWRRQNGLAAIGTKGCPKGMVCFDEVLALQLLKSGCSDTAISKACFCHQVTISNWRKRRGLSSNFDRGKKGRRKIDHERALELHSQGLSDFELACELRLADITIRKWRREHGIAKNPNKKRCKFDLETARQMRKKDYSYRQVGRTLNVSAETVKTWLEKEKQPEYEPKEEEKT